LRRRARRVRTGRTLTGTVAALTAIAVVGGAIAVTGRDHHGQREQRVQVSAPNFVLSDVDAGVLSSTFDADGARNPISPDLLARGAAVPGVQRVSGVLDTFAPVVGPGQPVSNQVPPRTAILFSYHRDEDVHVVDGRAPAADGEIAVDADFLSRNHTQVGNSI